MKDNHTQESLWDDRDGKEDRVGGADGMEHTPERDIQEEAHIQEEDVHILDKTPIHALVEV